jgi:YHS domain-containing protein
MIQRGVALATLLATTMGAVALDQRVADPSNATHCYTNKTAVALGGVDFVDLASKAPTDLPSFGNAQFSARLSGYTFHFLSSANRDAFSADPWTYAPAYGGF